MSKLNAIAERWVAALRSGEYEQGQRQLRDEDRFCCLGVLCDLAAKDGEGVWSDESFNGCCAWLSESMLTWSGLRDNGQDILMRENDEKGKTFAEIADIIEERADELFEQGA